MTHDHRRKSPHPDQSTCTRRRLAAGEIATVDVCECGMMQLHLGAVTVRMTPEVLADLAQTLRSALTEHAREHALTSSADLAAFRN